MSKINEYPQAVTINNNDLFVIDQESGGDHATKSASVSQIADKATSGVQTQIGSLSSLTTTDKSSLVGAVNEVVTGLVKSVFLTTTYACSYTDSNTIGYRGTGPNITTLTGYPTGKNILAVVIERSYVDNKIYPAITSLDTNILYTESKNSGTAYIGMRVLYTD